MSQQIKCREGEVSAKVGDQRLPVVQVAAETIYEQECRPASAREPDN
jgi:hypothetical protein